MSLECVCQEAVDVAAPNESAFQAAERMHQRTVGTLVVVDNTNTPIGIVTDRDLTVRVIAAERDPHTTPLRELMTPSPTTIARSATLIEALDLMRAGEFRRLPVVNDLGRLIGIVTLDDILLRISDEMRRIGCLLVRETPRAAAASVGNPSPTVCAPH
jgi:CBS domain-containing protein